MGRILLLENPGINEKFSKSTVTVPAGITTKQYVEQKVVESINKYNPKLNITRVEYLRLNSQFPRVHSSKSTGLIAEDMLIKDGEQQFYRQLGYYVWNDSVNWYARKINAYVYITPHTDSESRNSLIAQTIFPTLMDYIGDYINSPSYTFANHPIYLVNIVNKVITADSILTPMSGIIASGFEYVEVFANTLESVRVPRDPELYLKEYQPGCSLSSTSYHNRYYSIDFQLKSLRIRTDRLVVGDYLKIAGSYLDFDGSVEKHYWTEVIPIFVLACKSGYSIDYSELENFQIVNMTRFKSNSIKFNRFTILLNFMKKLTFNEV